MPVHWQRPSAAEAACATTVAAEFRPGKVEFSANSLKLRIFTQERSGMPIMADKQKEGPSKKRSGKSKKGKSSSDAGKPKFSAGTPPTACTRELPSLSPPKLDFQLQPIDLSDDPPVVSTVLSDLPADPRRVGPFQGQDGSPEPITQAGIPRQSEVDRVSDSHGDSTGAPPGVSTVELAVSTPVSRRRSDADMESLTRQMADEKAFCEQRTKKTEAMLVSFLAKAKGAPPAVLEAWGNSPLQEPSSPVRSVTARPEQPSSVSGKQKHKDRSSGNRDESPEEKGPGFLRFPPLPHASSRRTCFGRSPQPACEGTVSRPPIPTWSEGTVSPRFCASRLPVPR